MQAALGGLWMNEDGSRERGEAAFDAFTAAATAEGFGGDERIYRNLRERLDRFGAAHRVDACAHRDTFEWVQVDFVLEAEPVEACGARWRPGFCHRVEVTPGDALHFRSSALVAEVGGPRRMRRVLPDLRMTIERDADPESMLETSAALGTSAAEAGPTLARDLRRATDAPALDGDELADVLARCTHLGRTVREATLAALDDPGGDPAPPRNRAGLAVALAAVAAGHPFESAITYQEACGRLVPRADDD